jgi:trans-aconitate methyltransferase
MSVAAHLGIALDEYDARIRTFIPDYEEMLDVAADAVPADARTIVDVGTGTGALAARCLRRAPRARVVGIDEDSDVLAVAATRLGDRARFITSSFAAAAVPRCDAIVASIALHHIRQRATKLAIYRRFRGALVRGGRMISVDCHPSARRAIADAQLAAWMRHLRQSYSADKSKKLLEAWAQEDVYVPLDAEMALLTDARFRVDVLWRKGMFAVLLAQ